MICLSPKLLRPCYLYPQTTFGYIFGLYHEKYEGMYKRVISWNTVFTHFLKFKAKVCNYFPLPSQYNPGMAVQTVRFECNAFAISQKKKQLEYLNFSPPIYLHIGCARLNKM